MIGEKSKGQDNNSETIKIMIVTACELMKINDYRGKERKRERDMPPL